MKLRSIRVYGIMNHKATNLDEAVAQINNLYKLGKTLMVTTSQCRQNVKAFN